MATKEESLDAYRRTVTIIAVVIVLYLSFLIVKPFVIAVIGAALLAYLFYPFYKKLLKVLPAFLPRQSLSALITLLLIIALVLVPMVLITLILTSEARSGYLYLQEIVHRPGFTLNVDLPPILGREIGSLAQFKPQIIGLASQFIVWLQEILKRLPGAFLNIFIAIFSIYFFLQSGDNINKFLQEFFPLPAGRYKEIFKRFDELTRGVVFGQLVVAVIHGLVSWLAYFLLGVPNPVMWAFLTAIVSIIPVLGVGLVWLPISIYLLLIGYGTEAVAKGFILMAYGVFVLTSIDNILKPKVMGETAKIHPLIVFLGILGGIQLFGIAGILLGPLILALFDVIMNIFREVF